MSGGGICDISFKLIELKENKGQGYARNLAIKQATGDYIMFLDPDDWYELDAFEKAYNQITKNNNDFVIFSYYNYSEKNGSRAESKDRIMPFNKVIDSPHINLKEINGHIFSANFSWAQIYNRQFLLKNNVEFANARESEDQPFVTKAIVCSNSVSIINKPLYNYRIFPKKNNQRKITMEKRARNYTETFLSRTLALNIILESKCPNFIDFYSVNLINAYKGVLNIYPKQISNKLEQNELFKEYFLNIKKTFNLIQQHANLNRIKYYIDYDFYKRILASKDYFQYKQYTLVQSILQSIFSIKYLKDNAKTKIKVSILGLKFSIVPKKTKM